MGWITLLLISLGVVAAPAFMWSYQRRLDARTGPWIVRELSHDE